MPLFGGLMRGFGNQPYDPAIPGSGVSSPPITDQGTMPPFAPAMQQPTMGAGMEGMPPATPAATGMFGSLGKGRVIAGLIGDALQSAAGGKGSFLPFAAQQHQDQQLLARQAAQQTAEYQRQVQLAQFKAAHPDPTAFERELAAAGIQPGTPDYARLTRSKAEADAAGTPFVYEQYNPVTKTTDKVITSRGALGGGTAAVAPVPAPAGVTFTPLPTKGGAAPATGPGGFPLYPAGHGRSGAR